MILSLIGFTWCREHFYPRDAITSLKIMVKTKAKASEKAELAVDKLTAWQIYEKALQERKSKDPNDRRQACEKGWLAVTIAVDEYLATKGRFVPKGAVDSHTKRDKFLADLALGDENARILHGLVNDVSHSLHGACYYAGEESAYYDIILKDTVREILERTEHAP